MREELIKCVAGVRSREDCVEAMEAIVPDRCFHCLHNLA